jgi:hypothetical protein
MSGVFLELPGLRVPQVEARGPRMPAGGRGAGGAPAWVDGKFLRGPIPLSWLGRACRLSGAKVVAVALAVWFLAGLRGKREGLQLTKATLKHFGVVDRSAKYRALKELERAGLIRAERRRGKNPLVTIVEGGAAQAA